MLEKKAISSQPLNDVISRRWSCRSFNINKQVSRENIISICEAARWAPSCFGDEPWRIIAFDKYHNEEQYKQAFDCLGEWNQGWVKGAPVIIAAFADDKFRKNQKPNHWAEFDTGACCQNIYLQAVELGLMAHPMAGFDGDKFKKSFNVPDNFKMMAMIAIGYQDSPDNLSEDYRKEEIAPRKRRPLGENFFDSSWENPIT